MIYRILAEFVVNAESETEARQTLHAVLVPVAGAKVDSPVGIWGYSAVVPGPDLARPYLLTQTQALEREPLMEG